MENDTTSTLQKNQPSSEQLAGCVSLMTNTAQFFVNEEKKRAFYFNNYLYIEQRKIGDGSYSDVYLFLNANNHSLHALKILKDNSIAEALLQELQMMKDAESQFVLKIEEIIKIDDQLCILMEYANQDTLDNFISSIQHHVIIISANQILDLICDIFSGLDVLHSKVLVHRYLKMDRLLVSNYQIKLADFGFATYLVSKSQSQTNKGNVIATNQEKLNESDNHNNNSSSDIFSAGLIILQILLGLSNNQIVKMKINQDYINEIQDSPEILKNFILKLLDKNPQSRPTAIEAFILARKLQYDQKVIDYINNKINKVSVEHSSLKDNSLLSSQSSSSLNDKQNVFLSTTLNSSSNNQQTEEQLFQKGMQYFCEANYESADKCFSIILEQNAISIEALAGRLLCGDKYRLWINKNKQYTSEWVQDQLKCIEQLNPNHYMYHFCQGIINDDIDAINKCIELNPTMTMAIAYKGTFLTDENKVEEVIEFEKMALKISENNPYVLKLLGYIYYKINKDTFEEYYLKSLAIAPNEYVVLYNLGMFYYKKGELDKALCYYNRSLSVCPYYRFSIEEKFNIMQQKKENKEVIQEIQSLFSQYGEQETLHFYLAYSYDELGDYQNALIYYEKYLSIEEDYIDTIQNIVLIYRNQKDYKNVRKYYQKGIEFGSKLCYTWMYGLLTEDLDKKEEGLEILSQLLQLEFDIDDENECVAKIFALRELEEYEEFFAFADLALQKHPSSTQVSIQILSLISKAEFQEYLPEQFKFAETIENNQGIYSDSTKCQLKYFNLNGMEDRVVSQILKFIQNQISDKSKPFESYFNYPSFFENYITEDNLENIYEGVKKMYEDNPNNFNCVVCYIFFISLFELRFSNEMLEEIDRTCSQNKTFENYDDQELIKCLLICYKGFRVIQYYQWGETNETKSVVQDYLVMINKVDLAIKKRFKVIFHLSYTVIHLIVKNPDKCQFSSKELDSYKLLLSSFKDEGLQLYPDLADQLVSD